MGPASWIEEEAQLRGFADVAGDADRVDHVAEEHRLFQRDQAGAGRVSTAIAVSGRFWAKFTEVPRSRMVAAIPCPATGR